MPVVAIIVFSIVAFFTFGRLPFLPDQKPLQSIEIEQKVAALLKEKDLHRRKSVVMDKEGSARRTADGTQMTRRDRGREYWKHIPDLSPDNPRTLKNWLKNHISFSKPGGETPPTQPASSWSAAVPEKNFNEQKNPTLTYKPNAEEFKPAAEEAKSVIPPPAPRAIAAEQPKTQRHISLGRKIKDAILSDPEISQSIKTTIKVFWMDYKLTLRGAVPTESEKWRIGAMARELAGSVYIDNKIVVVPSTN